MLNIILTSYNRPNLIRRTLRSLLAQTSGDWFCYLLDDNSNLDTVYAILDVLGETPDPQHFQIIHHETTDQERQTTTRYSALINEVLPTLTDGVVGYLCDNVEYHPRLVEDVLLFFDKAPSVFGGYVLHQRDVFERTGADGGAYLGSAEMFGHWTFTPPEIRPLDGSVAGLLDHSQVFHRLPIDLLWNEDPEVMGSGDGEYFDRLIAATGPLYPIAYGEVRTLEHLLK